jgi:acetyltransferase-like isoleucine patch superfamily enzyme
MIWKYWNRLTYNRKYLSLQERFPNYEFGRETYDSDLRVSFRKKGGKLKIGAFCSIASGVKILLGGEHHFEWVTTYPFYVQWPAAMHIVNDPLKTKGNVEIGNDVWIGRDVLILSGIKIGDGAVIGARAVVASDVAPYAIAVGNPAKTIRKRFDDKTIQRLLNLKWWNWDDSRITNALPMMLNDDINAFLDAAEQNKI